MFARLLIANRGEIACRIVRTAKRMGIRTVAVYSEADSRVRHVREADEAVLIGPAPAADSYLDIGRVIDAAKRSGAQAIHPGYGFLSENADFAEACARAGIVFVGPPAEAIRAMGSKSRAKAIMAKAGVPLVPGYHGENQDPGALVREAAGIGFPVLIKPSAGGGGKGMRRVESAAVFAEELAAAKREAKGAFGDDAVLLERYLAKPRHVEVQVFADRHGECVHLFTRDCSVQRRHQKVVEEAPAPGLDEQLAVRMGEVAVAAARAVGYVGAGTVEFLVEGGKFFFLEMNARLQVEHPVTEFVTGIDLVEWQLRVADGEKLPFGQASIVCRGHAVEARLYAEDPARDFLPSAGRLVRLRFPPEGPAFRVDSGFEEGGEIPAEYDPLIAKLIAWGETRDAARNRLATALAGSAVLGPGNNLAFLERVVRHPAFAAGPVDTGFVDRHRAELIPAPAAPVPGDYVLAALALAADARAAGHGHSPWMAGDGWRLGPPAPVPVEFASGERPVKIAVFADRVEIDGRALPARGRRVGDWIAATVNGRDLNALVAIHDDTVWVQRDGATVKLHRIDRLRGPQGGEQGGGHLVAPMPGTVVAVAVSVGQSVARGAKLMVIEAMKMEHAIVAPAEGKVAAIRFKVGDRVREGQEVIEFAPAEAAE